MLRPCLVRTTIEALIDGRARVNVKDNDGRTALGKAEYRGHTEIVEMLSARRSGSVLRRKTGRSEGIKV